jgi:Zinc carboxypeptidase
MRRLLAAFTIVAAFASAQTLPTPQQYFGFRVGTDRKIVRYDKIIEYFQRLAVTSDRVRYRNLGTTTGGNPLVMLEIASPATLRNLDHFKTLERRLYLQGGDVPEPEREQIFREGKAVVLITNNIHSTEIGSSQMAIELAYRLATEDSPAVRKILDQVIVLLTPSVNPDGQIKVTDWYNKYLGTPQEGGAPPWLYHTYAGHDDNRDMFLLSLKETQMVAQVLWHDWFPSIWLDQHQQGASGPRMFTMPSSDPINPNVHPLIYRLNAIFGQTQAAALEAAGKDGIMHSSTYTSFWEGAMAWSGWWHNQVGLLTEAASAQIATPIFQLRADAARPAFPGMPRIEPSFPGPIETNASAPSFQIGPPRDVTPRADYPRPWLGGSWSLRDIVDYEMISTMALLESAADRREALLRQIYDVNSSTVEAGRKGQIGFGDRQPSYAVLIPTAGQQDQNEVIELVDKLRLGGVEVYRARQPFTENGETWAAGTYVVPFTQVFARYAKDLLEVQMYPAGLRSPGGASDGPYDVSAWSLGMQFGVKTVFAREPLPANLAMDPVGQKVSFALAAERNGVNIRFPYTGARDAVIVNRLLKAGVRVNLVGPRGVAGASNQGAPSIQTVAFAGNGSSAWAAATGDFEVSMKSTTAAPDFGTPLRLPRVGVYQPWTANIDEGWTRWVLDQYEFPYTTLHNADVVAGRLRSRFDAIIIADQSTKSILEGQTSLTTPAEYRGGLGDKGWQALKEFVDQGGTLISFGDACNLLVDKLPLPLKEVKRTMLLDQHDGPGTILNLQIDTAGPMGWGMAPTAYGFYMNSPFFELSEGFNSQKARVVARYPSTGVAASGYLKGEEYMQGRAAVVSVEMNPGRVVLFGIRPQHRAQTHVTLPLLFNALYWSAQGDFAVAQSQ